MVRRHWLLIVVILIGMTGPAIGVSFLEPPVYRSAAQILLARQELDENFNPTVAVLTDTQINNEIAYLTSDEVTKKAQALGAVAEAKASASAGSNVVVVSVDSGDAKRAAASVQAYLDAYADTRIAAKRAALDKAAAQLQGDLGDLQRGIDETKAADVDRRTALEQRQALIQAKLGQVETQQQLTTSGMTVLRNPVVPDTPFSPTPVRNGLLAAVLGLVLGVSAAVLLESVKQRPDQDPGPPAGAHPLDPVAASTTEFPRPNGRYSLAASPGAHDYPTDGTTGRG